MDRSWMHSNRMSDEYAKGVEEFLRIAHAYHSKTDVPETDVSATDVPQTDVPKKKVPKTYSCPCCRCVNRRGQPPNIIRDHLFVHGILQSYTTWIWHGESTKNPSVSKSEKVDEDMDDRMEDMIRDVGPDAFKRAHEYESLCKDKDEPLYLGCGKEYTRLTASLKLINLKAIHGWTDKGFTELLKLLADMLPIGNTLPKRTYDAKKILCPMGVAHKKIHACPNDCILYWKRFENFHKCPTCNRSRYKEKSGESSYDDNSTKGSPAKVLWYLPIIPRFKRLFANANDAKSIRWHSDERKCDGQIRHPADSLQWKEVDTLYPDFGAEPRNLRLALASDGMNPYGNLSTNHSSWPVLLVIYNLSPWLCMKRKYVMLSMMISGPKQPGNDIDVYLSPLIEDLRTMWDEGVDVFDGYSSETFRLHAMIFCTINDFPAYGNLSGYSVKGHKGCPICAEGTCYHQLKHGRKTVYLGHRKFLEPNHRYRKLKKAFNGCQENDIAPIASTGKEVYEVVKDMEVVHGKKQKQPNAKSKWKKRSVFFDLPYWSDLDVRHCIDVMHVEKNVCDSVIGTLLNSQGTKDGLNARLDLCEMGIRKQLHPKEIGKGTLELPPACYTLSKEEKTSFCECLRGIKVPHGYSSNVKRLVSMKDLKLLGLKSHDCHVLMQQLLPVAIRGILPKDVRHTITRLCLFFNSICAKVIDPDKLDELENEAAIILCQLEMYFPPSFFDIMVHLIVHLVREIRLCGPVYLRWMYPVERYMKILKGYVKNQYRPEASIVEKYATEEAIEFCSDYLSEAKSVGLPKSRYAGRCQGKGTHGRSTKRMGRAEVLQAHLYVLNNTEEVIPYLTNHKKIVKAKNHRMNQYQLLNEHNNTFIDWFKSQIKKDPTASETLRWLAHDPSFNVVCWSGYDINNYTFFTKSKDEVSTTQNSGVMVMASAMHFSSSKDANPIYASIPYFGVIYEIWELSYRTFKVPLFKCKWVNTSKNSVHTDEMGFTLVDLEKVSYNEEPFIMGDQAEQVFYVKDPSSNKWSVVLQGKNRSDDDSSLAISETPCFLRQVPTLVDDNEVDDERAARNDHNEGILCEGILNL